jgi:hypothetical protein
MELRTRLNGKGSDDQAKGLFVNGRSKNSSNFKSRSNENDSVKVKQNQYPSLRRKLSITIEKSMDITKPNF